MHGYQNSKSKEKEHAMCLDEGGFVLHSISEFLLSFQRWEFGMKEILFCVH